MVDQPLIRSPDGTAYVIDEPNLLRVNVSGALPHTPQRTLLVDKPSFDTDVQMMTPHWQKRRRVMPNSTNRATAIPALKLPNVMVDRHESLLQSNQSNQRKPFLQSTDSESFDPKYMTNFFSEDNFKPASFAPASSQEKVFHGIDRYSTDENMRVKNIINKLYQNSGNRAQTVRGPGTIDVNNILTSTGAVPTHDHLLESPSSARNFGQQSTTFQTLQPISSPKTTSKANFGKFHLNSTQASLPARGGSDMPISKRYKKIVTPLKQNQRSQPRPEPILFKRQNCVRQGKEGSALASKQGTQMKETQSKYRKLSNKAMNLLNNFKRRIQNANTISDDNGSSSSEFVRSELILSEGGDSQEQIQQIVMDSKTRHMEKNLGKKKNMEMENQRILKEFQEKSKGQASYRRMPNDQTLRQSFLKRNSVQRQRIIDEFSRKESSMEGMLNVKSSKVRQSIRHPDEGKIVKDYLRNFDKAAVMFSGTENSGAGKSIVNNLQFNLQKNIVKDQLKKGLQNRMKAAQMTRTGRLPMGAKRVIRRKTIFETVLVRSLLNNERAQHNNQRCLKETADSIETMLHYNGRYKQRDVEENLDPKNNGLSPEKDPRIRYMKMCLQNLEGHLPIFDKISNKTLCLHNYKLHEGHIEGLAEACEFLDPRVVNRMLFNNCGMTGDMLAKVLEGAAKMSDFKSLIYTKGLLNAQAIDRLLPIFQRKVPNHMEELSFIDCKLSPTLIEQLMTLLLQKSRIKKFALVHVTQHTDRSFESVVNFVRNSVYLKDLDLSWSNVRPQVMLSLLKEINQNCSLTNLSLAYNKLLEEQPVGPITDEIIEGQEEAELTDFNLEVVSCFKDFIKYNTELHHLDLTMTDLNAPAIKYICALLRKSQALSCLHLCGNQGLCKELYDWIVKRVKGTKMEAQIAIPPSKTQYEEPQEPQKISSGGGILGKLLQRNQAPAAKPGSSQKKKSLVDLKKRAVVEGIKNRNILNGVNMNDLNQTDSSFRMKKLLIQRVLGFKQLIPGSGQWKIQTHAKDECRHCNQSVLTVFLWNPRLGKLNNIKDEATIKHYEQQIAAEKAKIESHLQPNFLNGCPYIQGQFTGWEPIRMRNLTKTLEKLDEFKPDFIKPAADEGLVRQACVGDEDHKGEPLNFDEKDVIAQKMEEHYEKHWHQVIMPKLMYRYPHVANEEHFALKTVKINKDHPLFFHICYVKPGRSTYVIQHRKDIVKVHNKRRSLHAFDTMCLDEVVQQIPVETFVHQMLTPFRSEPHYRYFNPRHVTITRVDVIETKDMFQMWHEDTHETYEKIFKADYESTLIPELLEEPDIKSRRELDENSIISMHIIDMMPIFLDIFHYLQAKSPQYPLLDYKVVTEHLLHKMQNYSNEVFVIEQLESIIIETCIQNESSKLEQRRGRYLMNRSMLLEVLFRWAIYIYSDKCVMKDQRKLRKIKRGLGFSAQREANEYEEVTNSQSFYLFINNVLKPYHENLLVRWQQFRDEELWREPAQKVLTNNETGLKALFKKYALRDNKFLTMSDCLQMICDDSCLSANTQMVRTAFAMSKQTVINELDENLFQKYNQLPFHEFCEFIARLIDSLFADSELEEIPLDEKLEYILEDLLPMAGQVFRPNKTKVEEFSSSDDDY